LILDFILSFSFIISLEILSNFRKVNDTGAFDTFNAGRLRNELK